MKNFALFVWLISLGLQLEIIITQSAFGHPLLGPTEDIFVFFGVVPIQALLLVIWFIAAAREVDHDVIEQEWREDRADWGQHGGTPEIRGNSISDLITSWPNRIAIMVSAYRRYAGRFTVIALALAALALTLFFFLAAAGR